MINSMCKGFLLLLCLSFSTAMSGQFGIGVTVETDIYNRYANPEDSLGGRGNGSVLLNLGLGPKMWFGGENFSVSVESIANLGFFGLSLTDYKGLGNFSLPVLAKLNFEGLSAMNKELKLGFSLGGGIQWNRTELYYVTDSFKEKGGVREMFRTYVIQGDIGAGISGFAGHFFVRYGFNPDVEGANSINIGFQWDFNIPKIKKIDDPASRL